MTTFSCIEAKERGLKWNKTEFLFSFGAVFQFWEGVMLSFQISLFKNSEVYLLGAGVVGCPRHRTDPSYDTTPSEELTPAILISISVTSMGPTLSKV